MCDTRFCKPFSRTLGAWYGKFELPRTRHGPIWRSVAGPRKWPTAYVALLICLMICQWGREARVGAEQDSGQHAGISAYAKADVEAGYRLYTVNCIGCHGPNGDSVGSVNLRSGQFRRASSDGELGALVVNGIPGAGMPPHQFSSPEVGALTAFLRNMKDFDARSVAMGDPDRGKAVFEGKGSCTTCHRVNGNGSRTGPDLTAIGAVRAASNLERSLIDPTAGMVPINRPVRIVTKGGQVINGRRVNEDTYTVQLVDDQGRLISLEKQEMKEFAVRTQATMPSFRDKLTSAELADVVAYLASLRE